MTLTTWWIAPGATVTRAVAGGVLVPCSGSNRIEPALACTATCCEAGSQTVLICSASPTQAAGAAPLQLHCARAPVWIT